MKVVVVHRGARDGYQVAAAMAEAGILERLVTDLYWPGQSSVAGEIERLLGTRAGSLLNARTNRLVPAKLVDSNRLSAWYSFLCDKFPPTPFQMRARATRAADRALGQRAGEIARKGGAAILSYSYYGHSAFSAAGPASARILFQVHPHPASMRAILRRELADHPDCASSLEKEWELALPDSDFDRLCEEPRMAQHFIAASSFTRRTLIEHGAPADRVHAVPYGVDLDRFTPGERVRDLKQPLRILFAGTINQRKGIKYLLDAVRMLGTSQVQLVIRGRAVDDLSLVRSQAPNVDIKLSVTGAELLEAYRTSDLFVFPSVAEGFGHVLIESLASGLPVLSTTHTAAPDLITEGRDGFVIEPRRADLIAERLEWALLNRARLESMRREARLKAEQFTWHRFRRSVVDVVGRATGSPREVGAKVEAYV